MEHAKHTPGPWRIQAPPDSPCWCVLHGPGRLMIDFERRYMSTMRKAVQALNCHDELLEACKALVALAEADDCPRDHMDLLTALDDVYEQADAAIANVEGGA